MTLLLLRQFWPYLAIAALMGCSWYYRAELNAAEARLVAVEAIGKAQEERAKEQIRAGKLAKEKADHENAKTRANLVIALNSLRASNPRGVDLPPAPAGAVRPDLACFDRADLERAYGRLVAGARGIADEGTAATIDLNTAKEWAR